MLQKDMHQLQNFWKNKEVRQYIAHQIKEAGFSIYRVIKKYVCLLYQTCNTEDPSQQLIFIISLGKGFPVSAPQVYLLETFTKVSIKGYKDFLEDIIEVGWDYKFTLKAIKENIPVFILKIKQSENSLYQLQALGKYHLSYVYSYDLLKDLSDYRPYIAFQTLEEVVMMYILALTQTHFLIFKPFAQPIMKQNKLHVPKEHEIDDMKLVFVTQIQGLLQIRHNREVKDEFTFIFDGEETKTKSIGRLVKKFKITKSSKMIASLIKQFKHFKGTIQFESTYPIDNTVEKSILDEVRTYEEVVKQYFNKETITKLNNSYHKIVEFYTNSNLPYQQIFIRKISALFGQEDVRLIMSESPKHKKK